MLISPIRSSICPRPDVRTPPDQEVLSAGSPALPSGVRVLPHTVPRSRYKQNLINLTLKFFKIQGTVILRRWKTEPVIHQRTLSRLIAVVHASDLRDRLVGLVDHHNEVIREIIDQCIRRLPRRKPCQMTGIILDSRAESRLLEHPISKFVPLQYAVLPEVCPAA